MARKSTLTKTIAEELKQWIESGKSLRAWARENGLSQSTAYVWLQKVKGDIKATDFRSAGELTDVELPVRILDRASHVSGVGEAREWARIYSVSLKASERSREAFTRGLKKAIERLGPGRNEELILFLEDLENG